MAGTRRSRITHGGTAGKAIAVPASGSKKWNSFNTADMSRIRGLPGGDKSPRFSRDDLVSGRRHVFRRLGTAYNIDIHLIGWRTLIVDQAANAVLMRALATQVTRIAGERVRDSAIQDAPFRDRSGKTRESMRKNDPGMILSSHSITAVMGPTTFYAPFLEFGWQSSGKFNIFPFMIPASDKHQKEFMEAHIDIMGVIAGDRPRQLGGAIGADARPKSSISAARSFLYTTQKALGDIMVVSSSPMLGKARSSMLLMAQGLGDVSAMMNQTIATRVSTRFTGRITGRGLGHARSMTQSRSYTASVGAGQTNLKVRAFGRIAGKGAHPLAVSGRKFGK